MQADKKVTKGKMKRESKATVNSVMGVKNVEARQPCDDPRGTTKTSTGIEGITESEAQKEMRGCVWLLLNFTFLFNIFPLLFPSSNNNKIKIKVFC